MIVIGWVLTNRSRGTRQITVRVESKGRASAMGREMTQAQASLGQASE